MKSIKLKLLVLVLMMLSCAFFFSINETNAIYREEKTTTINLTIIDGSGYSVSFDSRGGTSVATRYVQPNDPVGTLPIPTKNGSNFAGWYDSNNQRVRHSTLINENTQLHAEWTEIVCKRVTNEEDLHTETCSANGGCTKGTGNVGLNNLITYGSVGDGVPEAGDAYNCDVDYDGAFESKESDNKTFIERFYFVRSKANSGSEDSAVMYYSTSYDDHGRDPRTQSTSDIDSVDYLTALTYLPSSTEWDNPGLIDLDGNGSVTRFVSIDDMETVCGTITTSNTSYFLTCGKLFWFENTRFQAKALGRAGIWMEYPGTGTDYYRIHTESFNIATVASSSLNMARPVMEIPMSALEGYYDEDRFNITFNTYNNDPNPPSTIKRYRGETIGSLPTPTRTGYTFLNWYTDPLLQNLVDPTELVSGNIQLYADWEVEEVTVTLHLNDGTISGVTSPITLDYGDVLDDLPDPTKTGMEFAGWYLDSGFNTPFDDTDPITEDIDLYAKWETATVEVTLHLNDGTISGVTSPITLDYGDVLDDLPDPTKSGTTFLGWYLDSGFNTPFDDTDPITEDIDLYAKWETAAQTVTVTLHLNEGTISGVTSPLTINSGSLLNNLPDPTRTGMTFAGWYLDVLLLNPFDDTQPITTNIDLYANWEVQEVTVTLHLNDGTIIGATSPITLDYGDVLDDLPDPTKTGMTFAGWYLDSGFNTPFDDTDPITEDIDLYAKWETQTVTVTLHLDGGTISGVTSPITLDYGDVLDDLPDPTKSGTTFLGWYLDSGFNTSFDDTQPITTNIDLYAKWYYEARIGDTYYGTLALAVSNAPTGTSSKTTITVLQDITLTSAVTIPNNKWIELDLQSYTLDSSTSGIFKNSGTLDIINGTMISSYIGSGNNIGYIIQNSSSGTVNISGGTLRYDNTGSPEAKVIENTGGTINITGGTLECNAKAATINIKSGGTLNVSGGTIRNTTAGKAQAIYMDGNSTVNISGDVIIENVSLASGSNARAAVDNNSGTLTITGGKITSSAYCAVENRNAAGTTYIGIDENPNVIDSTAPILIGKQYAVKQSAGTLDVYDGVYKSGQSAAKTGTVVTPANVDFVQHGTESIGGSTYNVYYLQNSSGGPYTVTFDSDNNDPNTQVTNIAAGNSVGSANMPNPTKTNYVFVKWFIYKEVNGVVDDSGVFTDSTPVTDNITVMAKWKPGIGTAIISPASLSLNENDTTTITVTGPNDMESYTFSSGNSNVATVDANGVVTGTGAGNTVITITGTESNDTRTVSVNVTGQAITHTVTFNDGTNTTTVQVQDGGTINAQDMPQDPTSEGYIFAGWVKSGTQTQVDTSLPITENITAVPSWKENVNTATISPNPIVLTVGGTQQITITATGQNGVAEAALYASSATSIVTVDSNGLVTAVGAGSTTITITGIESNIPRTINVSVNPSTYTITFAHNDGTGNTTIQTVNRGYQLGSLPQAPQRANYLFDGWFTATTNGDQVTVNTTPSDDTTYYGMWTGNINTATFPSEVELLMGQTSTVTPTGAPDRFETFTLTSNDTSVVTISNGAIVAAGVGTTTVTVTGSRSTLTKTIAVEVLASYIVTFDNDGVTNDVSAEANEPLGEDMPQDPTKEGYIFVGWYIDDDIDYPFDSTTVVTESMTVYAKWTENTNVARIGDTYYATLKLAFAAVPTTGAETEVVILQDIPVVNDRPTIVSNQNVVIVAGNHTLTCGNNNIVYNNGGTVTISDGTYTCSTNKVAPIENNTNGTMYITGGTISNTNSTSNGRGAVYNGGTLYVSGTAHLTSAALERPVIHNYNETHSSLIMSGGTVEQTNSNCKRGAIQNEKAGSHITITGGTVTSNSTNSTENVGGIQNIAGSYVTIGTSGNGHSTTSPIILGMKYGVYSPDGIEFYDGKIGGYTAAIYPSNITVTHETYYEAVNTTDTIDSTTYNILYYEQGTYIINLNASGGNVNPTQVSLNTGDSVTANDLPTPIKTGFTFNGWVTENNGSTPVTFPITASASGSTTIYASWTPIPVTFDMVNDAMAAYFTNVGSWSSAVTSTYSNGSWTDTGLSTYESNMLSNFNTNGCSNCNAANNCNNPGSGTHCDLPKGYDTGITDDVNVYVYDTTNNTHEQNPVTYTTSTGGIIYNMIPGITYYWESTQDSSVYGVVEATGKRRTIYTENVRNVRDLGGLPVDSNNDGIVDGTLKYGVLYRGAKLSSSASDATSLEKLGIDREIDLRATSEGSGQARMTKYDIGDYTDPNNVVGFEDVVVTNYLINPIATTYISTPHQNDYPNLKKHLKTIMSYVAYGQLTYSNAGNHESIYFHCTIGTDRTGTIAYFLEGLLGVPLEDRLEDYELSYFFGLTNRTRFHDYLSGSSVNPRFRSMYMSYPDYQSIYEFYTYGDDATQKAEADQLLADFKAAMIDSN